MQDMAAKGTLYIRPKYGYKQVVDDEPNKMNKLLLDVL